MKPQDLQQLLGCLAGFAMLWALAAVLTRYGPELLRELREDFTKPVLLRSLAVAVCLVVVFFLILAFGPEV